MRYSFWSPDGNYIFLLEQLSLRLQKSPLAINQPQPFAELFISDGSDEWAFDQDDQYEQGTPAWLLPVVLDPE